MIYFSGKSRNPEKINDNYLWSFRKTAKYSKYLSENPKCFSKIANKLLKQKYKNKYNLLREKAYKLAQSEENNYCLTLIK